ncbi:MAG: T9SS type A sorting domain-containing protein, partial [Saprospiraceae bacterium]|nr:T9SS type A sorting domain-containing protein [Saprospiraceae bacterium]
WECVFDLALERNPDVLVIVTDGWPKYARGRRIDTKAGIDRIVPLANQLKENGTRLLPIGKNLAQQGERSLFLDMLTSGDQSSFVYNSEPAMSTQEVDYIIVDEFAHIPVDRIVSLLECPLERGTQQIEVYPSPNTGAFSLDIQDYPGAEFEVTLYDNRGRMMGGYTLAQQDGTISIAMDSPTAGQYSVVLTSGEMTLVGRLVVVD